MQVIFVVAHSNGNCGFVAPKNDQDKHFNYILDSSKKQDSSQELNMYCFIPNPIPGHEVLILSMTLVSKVYLGPKSNLLP